MLSAIGVDKAEVGNPVNREVSLLIRNLLEIENRPPLLAHSRNRVEDAAAAMESRVEGINIFCTVDEARIDRLGLTFDQYLRELEKIITLSKKANLEIRVSVENFFNSNLSLALRVYQLADRSDCDRIGIADTLGMALSWDVEKSVGLLKKNFRPDIEVHFHNDLGQAVSNALVALRAGASWVDTTLLGIGERSGITALSTLLVSLYVYGIIPDSKYRMQLLTEAENNLAGILGKDVPFNLLTNRSNGFSHKAGVHLHGLINFGPQSYELLPPKMIGNERHLVSGTMVSGKTTKREIEDFKKKNP